MHNNNWHEIYVKQSPKLLGICRRYIKDVATAEDIVQDAFIVAIQKEKDLNNKNTLDGWLCRIVINKALNHLKYENKFNFTTSENIEFVDETTMTNTLELDKKSAILAYDFTQSELLEAIDSLSENHKSVFNLYIIDQFSHLEISKLLQISVGTSKSSLSRARKNIQDFLVQKLNLGKVEENKKRRVLFLLFLGFGNQLFAQLFRKSFQGFEIQPKNQLDLNRKVKDSGFEILPKVSHFAQYLTFGTLATLAVIIIYFSNKNALVQTKEIEPKVKMVLETVVVDSLNSKKENTTTMPIQEKNSLKNTTSVNKKVAVVKAEVSEKQVSKPEISKDTVETKVIVIKKQIIKKDTIYVQK